MVRDSCTSGAGEDEVYKPIWFAYDALDAFLNDGLTPRATINTTSNGTKYINFSEWEEKHRRKQDHVLDRPEVKLI
ncbi:hypothetical protein WA026_021762 [Henosepilachna vigintioctopunctata]|uniref:Uncharacterized protein n=1 Tax=Henosepilachna vigintioctopunctata TaxID=420089 RepID=A0AAW1TXX4_9CUCU